ncbi:LAETG motif-containing sortase-dependent surface protein [Kitasatospora sp. NPDC101183]|uniref:LAETG motif-containing sortase-dependent surface protein n=1 Tax=Kitasatospora sp. NPDC101183 TaxID=3364100 RepID=UPI0037FAD5CC
MRIRRTLVSAALVAAVISPAVVLSAAPAFAAPAAAQAQAGNGSLAELEKADAAALKAKEAAKTAMGNARDAYEAFSSDPQPYRGNVDKAQAEEKKAVAAFEAADKELGDASRKLVHEGAENWAKNKVLVDAAEKVFKEASAAKDKAEKAAADAGTALHNALVSEGRKVDKAQDAYEAASKEYDAAHKAYLDAKAAGQPSTEQPATEQPTGQQPAEQPAEKPGAVTPASDTTSKSTGTGTGTNKGTGTTVKAATTTGSPSELAETGSNPATTYLALGSGLALSLGAAALYVSRRQQARSTS